MGEPDVGPLVPMLMADSSSRILARTDGMLHGFCIRGRRGMFSKEHDESRAFGRTWCDRVREKFHCAGFFTTDELPRYGLSAEDRETLFRLYRKADIERDVMVLLTYERELAQRIRAFLAAELDLRAQ
ncbi:hypothetical protein [Streptomyces sp. KMM 9044]|uniref:hypothetical protein n=1 Tax=Streptomyces sp. KMM 9044 TaxID=2744474 RepID=UPI00215185ED|nr:hypothetical protein [Streptomyces sp. KMM 9044]WAX78122.1 hypothetical protein HUV60_011005 [Streptomyces sp. KMM 9044]